MRSYQGASEKGCYLNGALYNVYVLAIVVTESKKLFITSTSFKDATPNSSANCYPVIDVGNT